MFKKILFVLVVSSLVASCSKKMYTGVVTGPPVIYPSPPDTARIQFLTKFSGSNDLAANRKSFTKFVTGESEQPVQINKPYGVVIHKGKILICDTFIHGLDIIDLEKNKFEQFIPKGRGELKVPINCFVDTRGYLYIADSERKQVVIFDQDLKYVSSFGDPATFKPVDVFVRDDKIWVANLASRQIEVYRADSSNAFLTSFPEFVTGNHESLYSPTNLFVTADKVYVSDFGDFNVKIYDRDGRFIQSIGSYGTLSGQFTRPKGIAVDQESNLYVVDAGFENAQIFDKDGKLLMFFGGSYKGPGDMWLPAKVSVDYDNLRFFQKYVDPGFKLKYLVLVTNQFGPDKVNVYGAVEPAVPGEKQKNKN